MVLINPKFIPESSGLYMVGGCVRDRLIGRQTTDYDLAAEGNAQKIAGSIASAAGSRVITLGDPGKCVYRIVTKNATYDVSDIQGPDITADLLRRDFTINAMAINIKTGSFIDPTGGNKDLSAKVVRMVSQKAFEKDPLRLLRAFRLASVLDFIIDPETLSAISLRAEKITVIAGERIRDEWSKMLQSRFSGDLINLADRAGLLCAIFPELNELKGCAQNQHHEFDAFEHTMEVYRVIEKMLHENRPLLYPHRKNAYLSGSPGCPWLLKHAALLHDIGKPVTRSVDKKGGVHFYNHDSAGGEMVRDINRRLRFSNADSRYTFFLVKNHLRPLFLFMLHKANKLGHKTITRFFIKTEPFTPDILLLSAADSAGKHKTELFEFMEFSKRIASRYFEDYLPETRRPRLITGNDLIKAFGLMPSPQFSKILNKVEEMRLSGLLKTRRQALEYTGKLLKKK